MRIAWLSMLLGFGLVACSAGSKTTDLGADLASGVDLAPGPDLAAALTGLAVTTLTPKILVGDHAMFVATGTYSDGTKKDVSSSVTWSSTTPATATIDAAGAASGVTAGTTSISASLGAITSPTEPLAVRSVTSVALSWPGGGAQPPAMTHSVSATAVQLTATAQLSDSDTLNVTSDSRTMWTSDTPTIVMIGTGGLATPGNNSGVSQVSASFAGVSTTMVLMQVN